MAGGTRTGAGRKAAKIDLIELEKLCTLHCNDEEIASWFHVSVRTVQNRRKEPQFADAMRRGKTRGCINVRRAQMRLLEAGNATMAVWLGKSMLAQRDTSSIRMVMPKIRVAQDLVRAAETVTQAVARGKLTPTEGQTMMGLVESQSRIIVAADLGCRVEKIENKLADATASGPRIIGLPDQAPCNDATGHSCLKPPIPEPTASSMQGGAEVPGERRVLEVSPTEESEKRRRQNES